MPLILTASYVSENEATWASKHSYMLTALDELLTARYNGASWLAFAAGTKPALNLGDRFVFGTAYNLPQIALSYNLADEAPSLASLDIVSHNTASKVAFVSNALGDTLNRKTVVWKSPEESVASTWWLGVANQPERFERLRTADIVVENYNDPIAGNTSTFTYRSYWTKYGCIRIHNGNKHTLTVNIQGFAQSYSVPAFGILCLSRLHQTGSMISDTNYLPLTKPGDRMTYQSNYEGQAAGCMEEAYYILQQSGWLRYGMADIDYDRTTIDQPNFTGNSPTENDYLFDWITHTGSFISAILDMNTGVTSFDTVTWQGLNNGFGGSPLVNTIDYGGYFKITSNAQNYLGHSNWRHDLIPVSSNLSSAQVIEIRYGYNVYPPAVTQFTHLQRPMAYGTVVTGSTTVYTPFYNNGLNEYAYNTFNYGLTTVPYTTQPYLKQLKHFYPNQSLSSLVTTEESTFFRTNASIGRKIKLKLSSSYYNYGDFSSDLLYNCSASTQDIQWIFASSLSRINNRLRFIARDPRNYMEGNAELDGYGNAAYLYHPQDGDLEGTTDKSGSQQALSLKQFTHTDIQIEGGDYNRQESAYGMDVYAPASNLHYILENIYKQNWWRNNRYSVINTFAESQKLISWRIPRLIEHINDLVKAINNVKEVYPVDVTSLYRDPMPARQLPFQLMEERPFAVPSGWVTGRYDQDNRLKAWCARWGISYESILPEMDTLRHADRYLWCERQTTLPPEMLVGNAVSNQFKSWDKLLATDYSPSYATNIVNYKPRGYLLDTYPQKYAWYYTHAHKIFGGAATDSDYIWLTDTAVNAVLGPMYLRYPTVPGGERYTPKHTVDAGLTKLSGDSFSYEDGKPVHYREVMDAFLFHKKVESTGNWIHKIEDGQTFRIFSPDTTSKRRIYQLQQKIQLTTEFQWLVHEITEDTDTIEYHDRSISYLAPQASEPDPIYGPQVSDPAYHSLQEYYSDVPVLLVCGPEPYFTHAYDTISYPPVYTPETYTVHNPVGTLFQKEVSVADMPITADKIQAWSGQTWPVWHCQVIKRTGVLR